VVSSADPFFRTEYFVKAAATVITVYCLQEKSTHTLNYSLPENHTEYDTPLNKAVDRGDKWRRPRTELKGTKRINAINVTAKRKVPYNLAGNRSR